MEIDGPSTTGEATEPMKRREFDPGILRDEPAAVEDLRDIYFPLRFIMDWVPPLPGRRAAAKPFVRLVVSDEYEQGVVEAIRPMNVKVDCTLADTLDVKSRKRMAK